MQVSVRVPNQVREADRYRSRYARSTRIKKGDCMSNVTTIGVEEARRKPNAFHLSKSVIVHRPTAMVFEFIVKKLQTHYSQLARGHKKFEVLGMAEITEGAIIDCQEMEGNQEIHHRYQVGQVVTNKLIHFFACPSRVFVHTPGRIIETQSNTYVYFDLEPIGPDETRLAQTIIIQMPSFFNKLLGVITGTGKLWSAHLTEELWGLKLAVENLGQ
jgi:hypothetical protein